MRCHVLFEKKYLVLFCGISSDELNCKTPSYCVRVYKPVLTEESKNFIQLKNYLSTWRWNDNINGHSN